MSDEADEDVDAARDGGDTEDSRRSGGRTALVTKPAVRPQRPTGKRSRQHAVDAEADEEFDGKESSATAEVSEKDAKAKAARKLKAAKKVGKPGTRAVNPIAFVYNYLKQVVAEMRKVIWPNRKQMFTYTSVVLVFLAFMVALVGGADLGLSKLVLLVFG
ncbi:preprotein translocase subunit SecE [Mycobacterium riyadhense]|uniref:Protein translocase subunit SecE n=1 Tax=Mycobacterium riyadhense TaxID=486698 RepID=A0A1X2DC09_9MYCO|nr:preprotein translocase subunit SecE [Mycobacterium riyadhense]MCV7146653.1 preprotein translocase subunit SecE [Mycobacterium riyadhense]ORW85672.1 preprotein translocase subunit SecE [Mycobacterium riyadhense]VTO95044.1 preprotein translocase subunit SecE [Mycobacterium riyadhense]